MQISLRLSQTSKPIEREFIRLKKSQFKYKNKPGFWEVNFKN